MSRYSRVSKLASKGKIQATSEKEIENVRKAFVDRQPMGRIGKPNEIAELAIYLASNESSFVTGQAISIDGGWTNT